jgi:hypothetical protein
VYDTGLTAVQADENGDPITSRGLYGLEANFGVFGTKELKRTTIGVDYSGNYRKYSSGSNWDGTSQSLQLSVSHQQDARTVWFGNASAATMRFGFGAPFANITSEIPGTPNGLLFDSRTNWVSAQGGVSRALSGRASVSVAGGGNYSEFSGKQLFGWRGYFGQTSFAYRYSRKHSFTASYLYMRYTYPDAFGETDAHQATIGVSSQWTRNWTTEFSAGGIRMHLLGTRRVELDPEVAAIIGSTTGIEIYDRVTYIPAITARVSRSYRRGNVSGGITNGLSPGNGLVLTARNTSASLGASYQGTRKLTFSVSGSYNRFGGVAAIRGRNEFYNMGAGATYRISDWISWNARYDYRNSLGDFDRNFGWRGHRVMTGIVFSPGEIPIALW